ncbi:MAG: HEAT repeat domain-containing protein [Candidatus Eisenbacteria bacterium]
MSRTIEILRDMPRKKRRHLARLADPEARVRRGELADDPVALYDGLIDCLETGPEREVEEILHELMDLDMDLAAEAIEELAARGDGERRAMAILFRHLVPPPSLFGPSKGDALLLGAVAQEGEGLLRRHAIERIGRIGGRWVVDLLDKLLSSLPPEDHMAVYRGIHRTDPEMAVERAKKALAGKSGDAPDDECDEPGDEEGEGIREDDEQEARAVAADFLGFLGARGVPVLLGAVGRWPDAPEAAAAAASALTRWVPKETAAWAAENMVHPDPKVRETGLRLLRTLAGRLRSVEGTNRLIERLVLVARDLLHDRNPEVRRAAIDAFTAFRPEDLGDEAVRLLGDSAAMVRLAAIGALHHARPVHATPLLARLLGDPDEEVRGFAASTLIVLGGGNGEWRPPVLEILRRGGAGARLSAISVVCDLGNPGDASAIEPLLGFHDPRVRKGALEAIHRLDPVRAREPAKRLVMDLEEEVVREALTVLADAGDEVLLPAVFENILRVKGENFDALLLPIVERAPERLAEAAELASRSKNWMTRRRVARLSGEERCPPLREMLLRLIEDDVGEVRAAALRGLKNAGEGEEVFHPFLDDPDPAVRRAAFAALGEGDGMTGDDLVRLLQDSDPDVRRQAVQKLVRAKDDRAVGALASLLGDEDLRTRSLAARLLERTSKDLPIPAYAPDRQSARRACLSLKERVDGIFLWGRRIGETYLGRPVRVGRTHFGIGFTEIKGKTVKIRASDAPVTGGHPHGEDILRGILIHEIGHHLYDIGARGFLTTRGISRAEGVGPIYDVLLDERLERGIRSRFPAWGVYFDRLASYAFAQKPQTVPIGEYARLVEMDPDELAREIREGRMPGRLFPSVRERDLRPVRMRQQDMLRIPGLLPPFGAWIFCLRCGHDPASYPDPRVAEAVAAVPADLKTLPHGAVLEGARRIGEILGDSEETAREFRQLRRRMRAFRRMLGGLRRVLDRMEESGGMPAGVLREAPPREGPTLSPEVEAMLRSRTTPRITGTHGRPSGGTPFINTGEETAFEKLKKEVVLGRDPAAQTALVASIRPHIRVLRPYLERLGRQVVDEHGRRTGRRVDLGRVRRIVAVSDPNVLVHTSEQIFANAYIGILIDRSGSMDGRRIEAARAFGALVAESARGIRGIEGHVNAFDDSTFYRLGDFRRNGIASLEAGAGNNDAGGLARGAELAFRSRKRNKMLVMVSDGLPTECTFWALKNLVEELTRNRGVVCAQVAVAPISHVAFPHYVDLSNLTFHEAVARFGRLLMTLTSGWR